MIDLLQLKIFIIFMFITQQSVTIHASKEKIWSIWTDVANWNNWDHQVEWSKINGDFKVGITGILKPKGGPVTKFTMISCEPMKCFIDATSLPLAKMYFIHEMEEISNGIKVIHTVKITGPLSFLFGKVIGENIAQELPKAMEQLKMLAEK